MVDFMFLLGKQLWGKKEKPSLPSKPRVAATRLWKHGSREREVIYLKKRETEDNPREKEKSDEETKNLP